MGTAHPPFFVSWFFHLSTHWRELDMVVIHAVTGNVVRVLQRRNGDGVRREAGATLVEYALLVTLIAVVCVAAVAVFGGETSETFSRVGSSMTTT